MTPMLSVSLVMRRLAGHLVHRVLRLVVPALLVAPSVVVARDVAAQPAAVDTRPFGVQVVGTGRPVLLIPGLTNGGAVWDGTVDALKRDHQLHVFTLAGFAGQAPIAADSTWLRRMRDAIVEYTREQQLERPVIVGHSLGGVLALWIASTHPTLPGAVINVDGLPFLGATSNPAATLATVRPQAEMMRRMMLGPNLQGGNQATFARMQEAQLGSMIRDSAKIPIAAAMARSSDLRTTAEAMYGLYTLDLRDSLGTVRAPVLNLHAWAAYKGYGMTRQRTDAMLASQYRTLTTGSVRVHDSSYHFIMFDEPAWMLDEMRRFLVANR